MQYRPFRFHTLTPPGDVSPRTHYRVTRLFNFHLSFFFFQAEDGIRDIGVTGVQTCALPISGPAPATGAGGCSRRIGGWGGGSGAGLPQARGTDGGKIHCRSFWLGTGRAPLQNRRFGKVPEIGRASCRERVCIWGGGRTVAKE